MLCVVTTTNTSMYFFALCCALRIIHPQYLCTHITSPKHGLDSAHRKVNYTITKTKSISNSNARPSLAQANLPTKTMSLPADSGLLHSKPTAVGTSAREREARGLPKRKGGSATYSYSSASRSSSTLFFPARRDQWSRGPR